MSSIINFISNLTPRIKKADVQKDIETTLKELREITIPLTKTLSDYEKANKFNSKFYDAFKSHVYDQVKFDRKSGTLWNDISIALLNVQANLETCEKQVNELLQEDSFRDALNARGAHLLRIAGTGSFISRYIVEISDFMIEKEVEDAGGNVGEWPVQEKYIKGNMEKFARLLADLSIPNKDFVKMLGDIPDVYLNEKDSSTVAAMFTPKQIDPFNKLSGISDWNTSPIYIGRLMWETYQAERFHATKERKATAELRLIHLENLRHKENNPRLEKEIEGLEARIRKYDQKIRSVEESLV